MQTTVYTQTGQMIAKKRVSYMNKFRMLLLLILPLMSLHIEANAHRPVGIGGDMGKDLNHAVEIEDIGVSQVIYREISSDLPELWLTFEAQAGEFLDVQLGIPEIERYQTYRPSVAVIGPGLDKASLPFATPENLDSVIFESETDQVELFYEPFSDTNSWILGNLKMTLPETGQYYVVAFHPQQQAGKLWVALGKREEFGASDMVKMPEWLSAVREFHEVGGQAPLINITYAMLLGLIATAGLAVWWVMKQ